MFLCYVEDMTNASQLVSQMQHILVIQQKQLLQLWPYLYTSICLDNNNIIIAL